MAFGQDVADGDIINATQNGRFCCGLHDFQERATAAKQITIPAIGEDIFAVEESYGSRPGGYYVLRWPVDLLIRFPEYRCGQESSRIWIRVNSVQPVPEFRGVCVPEESAQLEYQRADGAVGVVRPVEAVVTVGSIWKR